MTLYTAVSPVFTGRIVRSLPTCTRGIFALYSKYSVYTAINNVYLHGTFYLSIASDRTAVMVMVTIGVMARPEAVGCG